MTLPKGIDEGLGDLLGAAALLKNLAKHRAEANEQGDVLQRGSHALGDSVRHQVERHTGPMPIASAETIIESTGCSLNLMMSASSSAMPTIAAMTSLVGSAINVGSDIFPPIHQTF